MLGMHPPFFQGVLVPLNMTNPVRFMTNHTKLHTASKLFLEKKTFPHKKDDLGYKWAIIITATLGWDLRKHPQVS